MLSKFQNCDLLGCYGERKSEFVRAIRERRPVRMSTLKSVDNASFSYVGLNTFDTSADVSAVNLTESLNGPTSGKKGYNNRITSRMRLRGLRLTGQFIPDDLNHANDADFISTSIARINVVYDRVPSAGATTFSSVFTGTREDGTEYTSIYCDANPTTTDRFLVLHDEFIELPSLQQLATVNGHLQWAVYGDTRWQCYDRYIDLEGLETRFTDDVSTGVPDSVTEGMVIVIVSCDDPAGGVWLSQWNSRCVFYD